ncbi:MAG: FAD-dependent oxidoreductase [Pseudomonadota bacterium]
MERLVIVGGGMAAARLINRLSEAAPDRYQITLIGAETSLPYDRVQLSSVLAGERSLGELGLIAPAAAKRILFFQGQQVKSISPATKRIMLADCSTIGYDKLVLATGSAPIRLPLPGVDRDGVHTFRDLSDVDALSRIEGRAIVIGGGLLGLEAAHGLASRGLDVTVVHLMPWLMERQLDREAGGLLKRELESHGVAFALEAESEAIIGGERVEGLKLKSGEVMPCDHLIMAVGIRPEKTLADAAGLKVGRGVRVNDQLITSDENVFAIGECAEHQGVTYGLVWPVNEQADVLAAHLAGDDHAAYCGSAVFTSLKISGVQLFSAGDFADEVEGDRITFRDHERGIYKKLVIRDDRLVGAVLLGDAGDGAWYASLIQDRTPISAFRDRLMFGRAFVDEAPAGNTVLNAA